MPDTMRDVHELHKNVEDTRKLLIDEQEAIIGYDKAIDNTDDEKTKEVLEHIKAEEENHVGMLSELLDGQSPPTPIREEEGKAEAEDILDKMVADNMTSEQAWQDFKSQYIEKSANDTTLDAKLDTVMSAVQEMKVDMDRISDTVPQMQGEIAEQETIENEQEDGEQIDEFGDDVTDELQDGAPVDEDGVPIEGKESEEDDDNFFDSLFAGESDEEMPEGETDESIEESEDGDAEDTPEGEVLDDETTEEGESDEEEDYVPIEDIMSEDEDKEEDAESDDETEDTDDSEDTEDEGEDSVEETEEEDEEILEKMIRILKSQDRRITALERENMALRKAISMNTVKTTHVSKTMRSRPVPPIRKMVSGSVSRPPIGVSYSANANRYDGADAVEKGMSAPIIGKASPQEVLAYCNQRANEGM